jgi:hypothetical protein
MSALHRLVEFRIHLALRRQRKFISKNRSQSERTAMGTKIK